MKRKPKQDRPWRPEKGEKFELATCGNAAVKVYRRERSNPTRYIFEVCDYSLGPGKRRLLSFKTHAAAWEKAEKLAGLLSSGKTVAAQMAATDAASYGRAIELLRPTGDSLEIAVSRYAAAVKVLGDGSRLQAAAEALVEQDKIIPRTVRETIDEMIQEKSTGERAREERTIDDLQNRLDKFAESFSCQIGTITTSEIQQWLDKLTTSERDRLNYRLKLNTLFKWAWRRNYTLSNPVEKTERPEPGPGEVEIYTPAELRRLIDSASANCKRFVPALLIGAFAGLRSSEIERLEWSDVDLVKGFIRASAKKRGTPSRRLVPIQPNLAAWLADYSKKRGAVWTGTHDEFSDAQQETAAGTAIQADDAKGIEAQAAVKWKHNGLRHSFISYRLAMLQDDSKTALEAGNSKGTVHAHYKELVTPEDAKTWFAVSHQRSRPMC